ncbi:MAG: hypothetical protein O7D86_02940 [Proteobacteria bacterium]|nr:hypothetical protein [Pseudomonadota bacterium]
MKGLTLEEKMRIYAAYLRLYGQIMYSPYYLKNLIKGENLTAFDPALRKVIIKAEAEKAKPKR